MLRSDSIFRDLCSAALCCMLAGQPVLAEGAAAVRPQSPMRLTGQDRVRYALNRLTFGPRPGEIEAVQKVGLDRWFAQQLNPESLDDSAMLARLDAYPAMKLSTAELMRRFPSPQMIRVMERTGAPLPADPAEKAIYRSQIEAYKLRTAAQKPEQDAGAMQPQNEMASEDAASKREARMQAAGVEPGQPQRLARELVNMAPQQRYDRILQMDNSELAALRMLGQQRLPALVDGMTPEQKETLAALGGTPRLVGAELMEQRLIREIYSTHQLEEVMTSFWTNHFNVYIRKNAQEPYYLPGYERDVIRPRALGNFEDLLVAVAKSPAMLVYLDNFQSIGPKSDAATRQPLFQRAAQQQNQPKGLNENYARELMELHTLGVNGGYTQKDVTEVAKVFTGWTLDPGFKPQEQFRRGAFGGDLRQAAQQIGMGIASANQFAFLERRHEPGPKTVLGVTIKESGEKEGLEVLHMLATSPATAHFISLKLAERFVSDHPDPRLVDKMAASFTRSHGEIRTVLKTMFDAPEFWASSNEGAKFKTPEEFLVSAVRATGAEVTNPLPLVQAMNTLGMPLYGAQPPTGYKADQETWLNTAALVNRMNFGIRLGHSLPGVAVGNPATSGSSDETKEQALEMALLGRPAGAGTRKTVLEQFRNSGLQDQAEKDFSATTEQRGQMQTNPHSRRPRQAVTTSKLDDQTANMIGLLIGSPEFQRK